MCFSIAKYLLFVFNLFIWLAGLATLGVGIWMDVDPHYANTLQSVGVDFYIAGPIVFIVCGCIMIVFGFFGCCGAIKENVCMLITYSILLFIVFGVELGIGIWALVEYDSVDQAVQDGMTNAYGDSLSEKDKDAPIIATESNLHCCGLTHGCADWENSKAYGCGCTPNVDAHCTMPDYLNCSDPSNPNLAGIYNQNCTDAVTNFVGNHMVIIGGIGVAFGLAELLGIIVACCLCSSIKKKD